ncbi:MAG: hypothetical protein KGJ07_04820, partial [Patescibacteria group bacterium]|nr:hypothetical protein [Patescibacteria group bacterium]
VCLSQLWYSPWGYGGSVPGCTDGLSFMVGKLHIVAVLLAISVSIVLVRRKNSFLWWIIGGIAGFIASVFFMTSFSKFIWEGISYMAFFQYPWRFLLLASFFSSFLAAGIVGLIRIKYIRIAVVVTLAIAVIVLQTKFFVPQKIVPVSSKNLISISTITWTTSKISDEYMPKNFQKPSLQTDLPFAPFTVFHAEKGVLLVTEDKTQRKEVIVDLQTPSEVQANIAYFPGWKIFVDSVQQDYTIEGNGMSVQVPAGKHTVTAEYQSTLIETVSNWVTVTSILLLVLGIIYERSKLAYGKKNT